jgi:periplasmic divalent cation tolerance protein
MSDEILDHSPRLYCVLMTTVDNEDKAKSIARSLVLEKYAACVTILPKATSFYVWEGRLEEATEWVLLMKTTTERVPTLREALKAQHPYSVPEMIEWPITDGYAPYLDWLKNAVAL